MSSIVINDASGASAPPPPTTSINPSAQPSSPKDSPITSLRDEKLELLQHIEPDFESKDKTSLAESQLAKKALHFLANATPTTLAGVAGGFATVTYVILGRIGLILIGAFVGVVSFIAFEARNPQVVKIVRGENGFDVLERLMLKADASDETTKNEEDDERYMIKALDELRPETREAIGGLFDALIRDYIKWWYNPLVPKDHAFPLAVRKALTSYTISISNHLSRKRPADTFLDLLTNGSSMIIVFMSELATAFSELPPDSSMTAADTVYNYLANHPESHLANLLNANQQAAKFKNVSEDLLKYLDANNRSCDSARIFLREIIANSVLEMILQKCSQADFINGWIVYLLEAGEPNLNQAIDSGMQTGRDSSQNVFADMDGNLGNIGIAKPSRPSAEEQRGRPKGPMHKKKLSRAEEELDEAMEEMKRMNAMIAKDDQRRKRESSIVERPGEQESITNGLPRTSMTSSNGNSPTTGTHQRTNTSGGDSNNSASTRSEAVPTPITPRSTMGSSSQASSPRPSGGGRFTNFDQIAPPGTDEPEEEAGKGKSGKKDPLTLHNASFTLHDDATGDSSKIRTKPHWDYLIQVEPKSDAYPGWMIVRRYSDFETLHEILRRIAAVSGATAFTELHKELPAWKIHTRESLRGELERYLRDACWYHALAESEGMKRFLEKSQGHTHGDSKTFGWETVGKNMLDVLTIAPKGAMESGKTLVGGVTNVFGNFPGLSRKSTAQSVDLTQDTSRLSVSTPPTMEASRSPVRSERASTDSQRSSIVSTQPGKVAPMERRPSYQFLMGETDSDYTRMARMERMDSMSGAGTASGRPSREHSRASSLAPLRSPSSISLSDMKLPPPPDEMSDDYEFPSSTGENRHDSLGRSGTITARSLESVTSPQNTNGAKKPKLTRQYAQLSEGETRVAVELLFAVINEMYTLSSAWNIRRTLLTAAKSFLLRPGNPSLLTVQSLIQTSVLDTQMSDAGVAAHLRKIRENVMPTDAERSEWPEEMTAEDKEKLRIKARQLLIRSGVPAALMGVMGQAATSEALGRVFDCLQIEEVARGLMFGLLLQFVRPLTH